MILVCSDVALYVSDVVRHLPAGDEKPVFTFIYVAIAGYCFVQEAECQVCGLGDGLVCVCHCVTQDIPVIVRYQIAEDAGAVLGKSSAAVCQNKAVGIYQ